MQRRWNAAISCSCARYHAQCNAQRQQLGHAPDLRAARVRHRKVAKADLGSKLGCRHAPPRVIGREANLTLRGHNLHSKVRDQGLDPTSDASPAPLALVPARLLAVCPACHARYRELRRNIARYALFPPPKAWVHPRLRLWRRAEPEQRARNVSFVIVPAVRPALPAMG
ncbi:hypothetical protein ANO11243_066470 [Dothideomycetidae sp. 11243]|nr:hypothetical protein ANO11243_066470 [fungal sp. No.11243]